MNWEVLKKIHEEKLALIKESGQNTRRKVFNKFEQIIREHYPQVLEDTAKLEQINRNELNEVVEKACSGGEGYNTYPLTKMWRFLRLLSYSRSSVEKIQSETDATIDLLSVRETILCNAKWLEARNWKVSIEYTPSDRITGLKAEKENKVLWVEGIDSAGREDPRKEFSTEDRRIFKGVMGRKMMSIMERYARNPELVYALSVPADMPTGTAVQKYIPFLKKSGMLLFKVKSSDEVWEATGNLSF